jgi:hypothetical protein
MYISGKNGSDLSLRVLEGLGYVRCSGSDIPINCLPPFAWYVPGGLV